MAAAKCIALILLFLLTQVALEVVSAGRCSVDSDCRATQCCLKYAGIMRWCVKKSNELSEACGGSFLCSECEPPFKCIAHERTFSNLFRMGTGRCFLDR